LKGDTFIHMLNPQLRFERMFY